ncbi:hypothetical protein E4T44_14395 [Aureobasidium sp. EXF-8845]|nr:hypothetical protein E4T45_14271 [Aureobasidium sp. EXF-8846]KAI4770022.1 hypothetical protein E4T44_14395 [Aureobasidium sp. EXF-8845]
MHKKDHLEKYKSTKNTEDLPGLGQYYCVECAKWFESDANLAAHSKGKVHKRRVKALKEKPYSQAEADAAAGRLTWIDNGKPREKDQELEMAEAT